MGAAFKETASRCTTEKDEGSHVFEIDGYSLKKGMGVGEFVRSATFAVGGYDWSILFYPDGTINGSKDHVSIDLQLMSKDAEVRALCNMGVVNQESGLLEWGRFLDEHRVFSESIIFGVRLERWELESEESNYIQEDRLIIKCVLTVVKETQVYRTRGSSEIEVPPSDITEHLGKMLEAKEGADVAFIVGGETFKAHRILLAARSPVFKAELFGPMMEARIPCVTIEDMQPVVFRALLHFIYTDSLPDLGDLEGHENHEMIQHLLVAADRYAMDRLKMICQNILAKNLDVENVVTTLALADQHNCRRLKDVCIEFIASPHEIDAVVKTLGYANLKRTFPSVFIDVFEKTSRPRKTQSID